MKGIKLTYAQVSFLYNNLDINHKTGDWYDLFNDRCAEFYEFSNDEVFEVQMDQLNALYFNQDMQTNAEEILRQLKMDVFYGSLNDTSTHNTVWCLGMTSDIIRAISNALNDR